MNDKPPPPNGSVPLLDLLDNEWRQLLVKRLTEVFTDTGYGKVTITIYKKNIVGIDVFKSFRGSDENKNKKS